MSKQDTIKKIEHAILAYGRNAGEQVGILANLIYDALYPPSEPAVEIRKAVVIPFPAPGGCVSAPAPNNRKGYCDLDPHNPHTERHSCVHFRFAKELENSNRRYAV